MCPRYFAKDFIGIISSKLHNNSEGRYYYYPQITDEKNEIQKNYMTWLKQYYNWPSWNIMILITGS